MTSAPLEGTEHHPHAAAVLGAALPPEGRPSHAYLFGGPAGAGKRTVARAFAAALLAEGAAEPDAVAGRVERGSHPDLTWVKPSGAHELLVGDIDTAVVGAAARTPFEARRRVFVIERADTMIDQAANKMLKTLEEPPPFAHLILLSDRPGEVLPTIASRCQQVRFEALPEDEVVVRLGREGVEPRPGRAAARLSRGDARLARELAIGDGPKLRAAAQRFARAAMNAEMAEQPWRELLAQARARADVAVAELDERHAGVIELTAKRDRRRAETEHSERSRRLGRRIHTETLDLQLALAGLWYRDVLCVALGAPDLAANVDREAELAAAAAGRDPAALRRALELVDDTRQRLPLNVTEELACEALGYRLERLLAE
jgi:DNA polymerase-3 subunit delta'